jgi:hypothetical protein
MPRSLLALWVCLLPLAIRAQPIPEAAAQLASRISSLLPPPATVSVAFVNSPAWPEWPRALEEQLRKSGLTPASPADHVIKITVSCNLHGPLLVAEIDARQEVLFPWTPAPAALRPRLRLRITPLIALNEQILDVLLADSGSSLLVLTPTHLTEYKRSSMGWTAATSTPLALTRPMPRDPRGRIVGGTPVRVELPGTTCALDCRPATLTWPFDPALPVRWAPDRNYLETTDRRILFYSAAADLFASTAGHIVDRNNNTAPGTERWSDDISALDVPCAHGAPILALLSDQLQLFELTGGAVSESSDALPLPGHLTALWPSETPAQATLVLYNSNTGSYEASRVDAACPQ